MPVSEVIWQGPHTQLMVRPPEQGFAPVEQFNVFEHTALVWTG
jgi:hypothetical protein